MTYKPKPETANWQAIPGVEWREYTDAEFDALCAAYDKDFPDQPRSLERWFTHEKTKKGGE